MASPAQVAANQANSLKSTGPRSVEGKSVSRFNALKHGIDAQSIVIPGEDPHQYAALADAYHREYRPESPSEAFHVALGWRQRVACLEFQRAQDLFRRQLAESVKVDVAGFRRLLGGQTYGRRQDDEASDQD